jgi:hypothetical protein
MLPDLHADFETIAVGLPTDLVITFPEEGDVIVDSTGLLAGAWAGGTEAEVNGADGAGYAAPVGALFTWTSDGLPYGYRVKGKTYMVPLGGGSYENDGTINDANLGVLRPAGTALVTAQDGNFKVWNRPREEREATEELPALAARAGSSWDVIASSVRDKACILRSRRD